MNEQLPPYLRIVENYRNRILAGELKDGDGLPSTRQLVAEWGVAHATAAKVLTTLASEGLAVTGPSGSTVSTRALGQAPADLLRSARRRGRIYPDGVVGRIVSAELVADPGGHVLEGLALDAGPVIGRTRVTAHVSGPAVAVSTSWLPGEFAESVPELLGLDRLPGGTIGAVEAATGRQVTSGVDQVRVVHLDVVAAEAFGVPEGTAAVGGFNWWRDADGSVVEFGEFMVHPEHALTYTYGIGD